jgi:hypothetical protein
MAGQNSALRTTVWAFLAAFGTYFSMYAFRKPFAAAAFEGLLYWGLDYKTLLVISQLVGYLLSKFLGIKVISEMRPQGRLRLLIGLLAVAELALLGFALTPAPWNFPFLFLNGIPLGLVFGVVFSFLEGRRTTELMSLGLGVSIIFASGAVKSVGKLLLDAQGVSPWWMPALTGLLFVPLLGLSLWMLGQLPPPSPADLAARSPRAPMDAQGRRALFRRYAPGLLLLVLCYIVLTTLRDLRDNFAVEIWAALGVQDSAGRLAGSELWVSLLVLGTVGALSFVSRNALAFRLILGAVVLGGVVLGGCTWLFQQQYLSPMGWVVGSGFGLFLAYTVFQGILFERMIAHFREAGNVGFLMYLADAFGYLGSAAVLFWRNFGANNLDWLAFFSQAALLGSGLVVLMGSAAMLYFQFFTISSRRVNDQ